MIEDEADLTDRGPGFWIAIATKSLVPAVLLIFVAIIVATAPAVGIVQVLAISALPLAVALHIARRIALDFSRGTQIAAAKAERFPIVFKRERSFALVWLAVAVTLAWIATLPAVQDEATAQGMLVAALALIALRLWFTLRRARAAISLGIDGFHDPHFSARAIPWKEIAAVREIHARGGTFAVILDLLPAPDRKSKLRIWPGDLEARPDELIACIELMRRRARGDLAFKR